MAAQVAAPVVAGIDESPQSLVALRYAAWEAASRGVPLRLMNAVADPILYGPVVLPEDYLDPALREARTLLEDRAGTVRREHPGLAVDWAVTVGQAAGILVDASRHASLVVVGSRGLGGFAAVLSGSVSRQLASHAHCPVIVVRPAKEEAEATVPGSGPVVVGVDGSEAATVALGFAFGEAAARGVGMVAVYGWKGQTADPLDPAGGWSADTQLPQRTAERMLAEVTAGWAEKFPDVVVRRLAVPVEHPAQALLDTADNAGASLIVVGTRGRGGFAGLRLGSVSHALTIHAHQPVAVVPANPAG